MATSPWDMASFVSNDSPKLDRNGTPTVKIIDDGENGGATPTNLNAIQSSTSNPTPTMQTVPLLSSKFGNLQLNISSEMTKAMKEESSAMESILARLRAKDCSRKTSASPGQPMPVNNEQPSFDKVLMNLNIQNETLRKQQMDVNDSDGDATSPSDLCTPATEAFEGDIIPDTAEIMRVKEELAAAKSLITRQEQELAESRNLKHTMDQAMGPPSEVDFGQQNDISEQTIGHLQSAFNASARPFTSRSSGWHPQEDSRSDNSDSISAAELSRSRDLWNQQPHASLVGNLTTTTGPFPIVNNAPAKPGFGRPFENLYGNTRMTAAGNLVSNQRNLSSASTSPYGFDQNFAGGAPPLGLTGGNRRSFSGYNRSTSTFASDQSSPFGSYGGVLPGMGSGSVSPIGIPEAFGYQPRPIGSPVSPLTEYTSGSLPGFSSPWSSLSAGSGQTYVTPLEPMNYRRLLDKSVSCDWKYIVDKIVCSNDQQASIFLQQKLKVGTAEQKFDIVESIVNQAYPLMINRFGNFLVQRCFEHGTPDQVVAIANAIHGNVLSLSMDAFGCHVIQKAFDSVPEQHKADMVRELLRRIPDTVIHRYACHVWQKLFELRWSGEPPQIMLKVNEALRGMWHEVALGETGSLVVQNIFENCVEEEKRPAIEEVIASIDLVAHGQFGNWCIQHLCEHGSPPDKRRVIDHILVNAYEYSIDQFASKVVEKCLKIGGVEFLDRYLTVITTAHPDRPRIPLIDISGDQYGNYLIQWILMNTHHHQREQVAVHIRKHMVSLRGSKFGSRVAMLCCNPASITRPGPGVVVNPFGAPGQPRGWGRFR